MDADIIVAGAGPAGSTAALLAARAGRRVLLVDAAAFPRDKACGDLIGTYAIDELQRHEIRLDIIDETDPLRGAFVFAPDETRLGATLGTRAARRLGARVIPRKVFDAALVAAATDAGATFVQARIAAAERDSSGAVCGLRLTNGTVLQAPITIGADGWGSTMARALPMSPRRPCDIGVAARAYIADVPVPDAAMRFYVGRRGDGYGWIFPLGNGLVNAGLGFVRGEAGSSNLAAAFARFLQRPELQGGRQVGAHLIWPIPFGWRATPMHGAGLLLAGDAASLASPLSGSGIHTAIASGALAADVALWALARENYSATTLKRYADRLQPIARRLRIEGALHAAIGTPSGAQRALRATRWLPGIGRAAAPWLLNLG